MQQKAENNLTSVEWIYKFLSSEETMRSQITL